jgi:hypothetical protein
MLSLGTYVGGLRAAGTAMSSLLQQRAFSHKIDETIHVLGKDLAAPSYPVSVQRVNCFSRIESSFDYHALKVQGTTLLVFLSHKAHQPKDPGVLAQFEEKTSRLYLVGGETEPPIRFDSGWCKLAPEQFACLKIDLEPVKKFTDKVGLYLHYPEFRGIAFERNNNVIYYSKAIDRLLTSFDLNDNRERVVINETEEFSSGAFKNYFNP